MSTHAKLLALAAADHRSLNNMMIALIEEAHLEAILLPLRGGPCA